MLSGYVVLLEYLGFSNLSKKVFNYLFVLKLKKH